MSRCVRDRTLWLLTEGEASREERAHVATCAACVARFRRLERKLSHLQSVLSGASPPVMAPVRSRSVRLRLMAPAAALAAVLMVAWCGVWWQQRWLSLPTGMPQESAWNLIEAVSTALFSTGGIDLSDDAEQLSDLDNLQAALAGEWPCDGIEVFATRACHHHTGALLLGEL
jgi:hypothetical protein